MTYRLASDSTKRLAAAAFGQELRLAMATRKVGQRTLSEEIGTGRTNICWYLRGEVLPRVAMADTIAASLDWPQLATLIREARTVVCRTCGATFLNDSGGPARYCPGGICQRVAEKRKAGLTIDKRADVAERRAEEITSNLMVHQEAIAAFCHSCEPGGTCRNSLCELRPVSPLALHTSYGAVVPPAIASRGTGRHNDERRAAASMRMRRRWASDEARVEQGARARAWWEALTADQRSEQMAKIRAGKGRAN